MCRCDGCTLVLLKTVIPYCCSSPAWWGGERGSGWGGMITERASGRETRLLFSVMLIGSDRKQ